MELLVTVVNYRAVSISGIYLQRDGNGLCAGRPLDDRLLILEAGTREPRRTRSRTRLARGERHLMSMVNIYCPACHISSPREPRELSQLRSFCTVCGAHWIRRW